MSGGSRTVKDGWEPTRHGIPSSYNRGCHCEECCEANTGGQRRKYDRYRAARRLVNGRMVADVPAELHGRESTYVNRSCRCEACCDAVARARRGRKAA